MGKRRPMVAGNWKMNTDRAGALRLALDVADGARDLTGSVDVAVCPPFVYIDAVGRALSAAGSAVALGAQDVYFEPDGAFTGEVSAAMLRDLACSYVLTGHSERRHVLGESDELVAQKTAAVLSAGLSCILCVGETIEQRRANRTDEVNEARARAALKGLTPTQLERLTVAYEPVWAIGTGMTATPADAQDAHAKIRRVLHAVVGESLSQSIRILYGGSVKPSNAAELFSQPDIDGGLIGGASLKASDFLAIVRAAKV
jgi:triosephosphate isomerase